MRTGGASEQASGRRCGRAGERRASPYPLARALARSPPAPTATMPPPSIFLPASLLPFPRSASVGADSGERVVTLDVRRAAQTCANCGNADEARFLTDARQGVSRNARARTRCARAPKRGPVPASPRLDSRRPHPHTHSQSAAHAAPFPHPLPSPPQDVICTVCGAVSMERLIHDGDWTRSFEGEESTSQVSRRAGRQRARVGARERGRGGEGARGRDCLPPHLSPQWHASATPRASPFPTLPGRPRRGPAPLQPREPAHG